jgi:transposase-like protein
VKVAGRWMYLYPAVDQHGKVIDVLVSARRNAEAARAFFARALQRGPAPVEVTTDRAPGRCCVVADGAGIVALIGLTVPELHSGVSSAWS